MPDRRNFPGTPDRPVYRLVGVVHLKPLPGAPGWQGDIDAVRSAAAADARAFAKGGADALIIENFGDVPFTRGRVDPETVAAMALAADAVREVCDLPVGFYVLRNDVRSALGLAAACDGGFVRANVHSGAVIADQGLLQGDAYTTVRLRRALCPAVAIWADVHVKHASPLGSQPVEEAAEEAVARGLADAVIVSGRGTGQPASTSDLAAVRAACPEVPLYVGSGADVTNAAGMLEAADGLIVGSSVKRDQIVHAPVDPERVRALRDAAGW
jgi:membrane complex biogenesis BtpA family protein